MLDMWSSDFCLSSSDVIISDSDMDTEAKKNCFDIFKSGALLLAAVLILPVSL